MRSLLPKLGEWRPTSGGRATFSHQDEATGWQVALTVEKNDALSCQLWDLELRKLPTPRPVTGVELQKRAVAIAAQTTGLLEPLRVIEVDVERGEAILRSDSPTVRGDKRSHYELSVTATRHATLRRFQAGNESTSKREQMKFTLTHEVLANLVEDLTTALV